MTCIEKLKEFRPNLFNKGIEYVAMFFCPGEFGLREPDCNGPFDKTECIECWKLEACEEE